VTSSSVYDGASTEGSTQQLTQEASSSPPSESGKKHLNSNPFTSTLLDEKCICYRYLHVFNVNFSYRYYYLFKVTRFWHLNNIARLKHYWNSKCRRRLTTSSWTLANENYLTPDIFDGWLRRPTKFNPVVHADDRSLPISSFSWFLLQKDYHHCLCFVTTTTLLMTTD